MRCPICKLENPDSALRCDCGYDFSERKILASYLGTNMEKKKAEKVLLALGWASASLGGIFGIIISCYIVFSKDTYGFRYDTKSRKLGITMLLYSIIIIICFILRYFYR